MVTPSKAARRPSLVKLRLQATRRRFGIARMQAGAAFQKPVRYVEHNRPRGLSVDSCERSAGPPRS